MSAFESLSPDERAWLRRDEQLWQQAYALAKDHAALDASGLYRVLRNLEKSPAERLRAALHHGRSSALTPAERAILAGLNRSLEEALAVTQAGQR